MTPCLFSFLSFVLVISDLFKPLLELYDNIDKHQIESLEIVFPNNHIENNTRGCRFISLTRQWKNNRQVRLERAFFPTLKTIVNVFPCWSVSLASRCNVENSCLFISQLPLLFLLENSWKLEEVHHAGVPQTCLATSKRKWDHSLLLQVLGLKESIFFMTWLAKCLFWGSKIAKS